MSQDELIRLRKENQELMDELARLKTEMNLHEQENMNSKNDSEDQIERLEAQRKADQARLSEMDALRAKDQESNLKKITDIWMKNNHFFNITYDSPGVSSNLIYVSKVELNSLTIEGNLYEDSELNFMFI